MAQENYLQFPAKVRPRLRGGYMHKIRIDRDGMEIATWSGLYGNKESCLVLAVTHSRITTIEYTQLLPWVGTGYCRVNYLDESEEEKSFKFHIVDPGILSGNINTKHRQNQAAEAIAIVSMDMKQGRDSRLPFPLVLDFKAPSTGKKFFYSISLFAGFLIVRALAGANVLSWFFGTFLLCMSLAALCIDYFRIHTGWHPLIKLGASVVVFFIAFVLFVTAMTLFEGLNLI